MKAVLMSIQPKLCELIASGKKTVEVRKTKPKLETPFKVYIYCTKDGYKGIFQDKPYLTHNRQICNGKVIGEFVCDFITNYEAELWDDETFECIKEFYEPDDFAEYGEYEYKTIADNSDDFWKEQHLCKVSCLSIEELRKYIGTGINEFYGWHISNLVIYNEPKALSEFINNSSVLTFNDNGKLVYSGMNRPPQSWCYVERSETK